MFPLSCSPRRDRRLERTLQHSNKKQEDKPITDKTIVAKFQRTTGKIQLYRWQWFTKPVGVVGESSSTLSLGDINCISNLFSFSNFTIYCDSLLFQFAKLKTNSETTKKKPKNFSEKCISAGFSEFQSKIFNLISPKNKIDYTMNFLEYMDNLIGFFGNYWIHLQKRWKTS